MRPIGVCYFDNPLTLGSGWASHDGCPAYRVDGVSRLSTEYVWVLNLTFFQFRHHNLYNVQHLRDMQYFRCKLSVLQQELGISGPQRAVEMLSKCFTRVVALGSSILGIDNSVMGYRYLSLIQSVLLPPSARKRPEGVRRQEIELAIQQSYQANQSMVGKKPVNATAHCFSFPRHAFNLWLLGREYPASNEWSEIAFSREVTYIGCEDGDVIPGSRDIKARLLDWSASKEIAAIFQIGVESQDKFYTRFAMFGAGHNGKSSAPMRAWVTLPELLDIARYSKIRILRGMKTQLGKLPLSEEIMGQLSSPSDRLSFSKGLLLENIAGALGTPFNEMTSSLSAYVRAYDRIACGRVAETFAKNSYVVGSYSSGKIFLMLKPVDFESASSLASSLGLLPPVEMLGAVYG